MEPSNRTNRTWLCSVIFMDIVGYSIKSVSQQAQIKERFNAILTSAIRSVSAQDRIILDTGDGAAICFLGDPEDVLFAALELRAAFAQGADDAASGFGVRIGVNLGPVKLIHDVNGSLNAIGDGINVAQRVMSFAEPNCVLVSRSFYEVVGCLSEEYEQLFQFEGTRKDKHIREHTVYALQAPDGTAPPLTRYGKAFVTVAPIDDAALQQMETELSQSLGPVARVLVRKAAASATSASELAERLAGDYLEETAREAFVKKYRAGEEMAGAVQMPSAMPKFAASVVQGTAPTFDTKPLEDLLAEYVGPLARILVKRAVGRVSSAEALIEILKEEVQDEKDKAAFVKRAGKLRLQ